MSSRPELLELWYTALRSQSGIRVRTSDVKAAKQKLYAERAAANDERLASLSLTDDPARPDCLWIVHNRVQEL